MKVGWMDIGSEPDKALGDDDKSYGYDGYICKKWHNGPEVYGKQWKIGDVIGCFLDMNDKTICTFSL